jgi:hypothetical protein
MRQPFSAIFFVAAGAWVGALLYASAAAPLLLRRLGRAEAWRVLALLLPLVDLVGAWAGGVAAVALSLGRSGFGFAFAASMSLLAVTFALSLYDRAVLVPFLDAADKRLAHGAERERWEADWRFLWRLQAALRLGSLAMASGALVFGTF